MASFGWFFIIRLILRPGSHALGLFHRAPKTLIIASV
jgi:hypothetical protein